MATQFNKTDQPVIVEPTPISDIFIEGVARVEKLGSCMRFHLYVSEVDPDGVATRVIVAKIVCPIDTIPLQISQTMAAMETPTNNKLAN